jgi:hypothetical protein
VDYSTCPPSRGLKRSKAASVVVVVARENKTEDKEDQEEHNRNASSSSSSSSQYRCSFILCAAVSSYREEFHRTEEYLIKTEERERDSREMREFSHLLVKRVTRSLFDNV